MIKKAVKYQSIRFGKTVVIYYGLISAILGLLAYFTYSPEGPGIILPGMETITCYLLFGLGLDGFGNNLKMFLQNGISRKSLTYSYLIIVGGISIIMGFVSSISNLILNQLANYDSVLANINYLSNHAILKFLEGYLYITLLYMIYAMIGLSIAVIYFRMSKRVRIITLISGSIFIVGGPILIGLNSHTAIVRGVIKFIIDLSGIIRNSNIYLVYMIILVVLGALSYQLIKKAVVKTS